MSDEKDSDSAARSTIFSSQEFMEFLSKQAGDISTLEVTTKSGDRISASFGAPQNDGSLFNSLDAVKSLFKSEDLMKTAPPSMSLPSGGPPPKATKEGAPPPDLTSRDWYTEYAKNHVDVSYGELFKDKGGATPQDKSSSSAMLPPKKRAGKTDWNSLYSSALSPLVEAASRVNPQPESAKAKLNAAKAAELTSADQPMPEVQVDLKAPVAGDSTLVATVTSGGVEQGTIAIGVTPSAASSVKSTSSSGSKRKPRKVIPDRKEYIDEYTENDVLFGRGGRSNHHLGNKVYRDLVTEKQAYYKSCDKNQKTAVAQSIVDEVQQERKGRFLELCKETGKYFVVPNIMARRKVGQALRENNTEEARAAKREKYGQKSKKESLQPSTTFRPSSKSPGISTSSPSSFPSP
eukprot:Nitzschia sp. Nitz4//scaffold4_size323378//82672//83976//NITZ4_000639-RA/size323378-snap-gene-0.446-mRNA-1//-1//CDS//3329553336//5883//frame0